MEDINAIETKPLRSTLELSPILIPYILAFFLYLGLFSNFPIYLQITQNLSDVETAELWALISGVALFIGALTRIPAGILSDKIGRIKALVVAYFVYFLSLSAILIYSNNFIFVFSMTMIRFGTNIVAMTGRGTVSTSKRDLGLKNGLLFSISGFGAFLGPTLLGYILDNFAPDYIIIASLSLVIIDLIVFTITIKLVDSWLYRHNEVSDLDFSPVINDKKVNYFGALRKKGILRIQILFMLTGLTYALVLSVYSIYGFNVLKISPSVIGLFTGLGSLSQTISAPIIGRMYQYVKDEYMRLIMWLIMMIGSLMAVLSSQFTLTFYLCFIFLNVGFSGYFTMEITNMRDLVEPEEFSFVFGFGSTLVILTHSIAGFILPYLYRILPEMNFILSLIISGSTFLYILFITPRLLRDRTQLEFNNN